MAFQIEQIKNDKLLTLKFSGAFDEDVSLQAIPHSGFNEMRIDFDKVEVINSCGIREWINWVSKISNDTQITFENIPRIFVNQMNIVIGFFPENAKIESFYTPYVCESCELFKNILFRNGIEFKGDLLSEPLEFECEKCSNPMEMDVVPNKYFLLLKKSKK